MRQIGICKGLDRPVLDELAAISRRRSFPAGAFVAIEGDACGFAFNVVTGGLKIHKALPDGRTQMVGLLLPGSFLGLPPRGVYNSSAEALPGTTLCQYPRGDLLRLIEAHPAIEERLLTAAYDELSAAQEHMLLLGRLHATERVAAFLMQLRERMACLGLPSRNLSLPLQRHEIADYLGLTTETVSRTFTRLRADGVIRLDRPTHVSIVDPGRLARLADGGHCAK